MFYEESVAPLPGQLICRSEAGKYIEHKGRMLHTILLFSTFQSSKPLTLNVAENILHTLTPRFKIVSHHSWPNSLVISLVFARCC